MVYDRSIWYILHWSYFFKKKRKLEHALFIDSLQYSSIALSALPTLTCLIIPKCYNEGTVPNHLSKWRPWDLGNFRNCKSNDQTLSTDLLWWEGLGSNWDHTPSGSFAPCLQ